MKYPLAIALITGFCSVSAVAQSSLGAALPGAGGAAPVEQASPAAQSGPSGAVDKVLAEIARNMKPSPDLIDAQAETAINRDVSISRSTGQLLRPVGFMQIGDERAIFASEDGNRVAKLKEQSRLGVMRITKISEDGVEYTASGKVMYAPLAYLASEPPKAVPMQSMMGGQQGGQQASPAAAQGGLQQTLMR